MYVANNDLETLKESLRRFQLKGDLMAAVFYENLMRDATQAVTFFSVDISNHPEKALQSLYAVVALLEDNAESKRMIVRLKRRQEITGFGPEIYAQIAPVLQRTIKRVFGNSLPAEHYQAWDTALAAVGRIIYETASDEG